MLLQETLESRSVRMPLPLSSSAQDRLWISQTLQGDPLAYSYLVNKYKDQLFDLTYRILKDRCQGEDILQDAFLQAYQNLGRFRNESTFLTWIYSIVLNRVRNHFRRSKIIRWSSLDAPRIGQDETYAPEMEHKETSIDTVIEKRMDLEAVHRIVSSFSLSYQSIFIMYYFQNLPLQEIADRLGRPIGTVKVYLHRSRKMLYQAIASAPRLALARDPSTHKRLTESNPSILWDKKYSALS